MMIRLPPQTRIMGVGRHNTNFREKRNLDAKILDKGLKNTFKWSWFEDIISCKDHTGNEQKEMVGDILCNKQGVAVCKWCD